jgi:hypothetical protein
MKKKKEKRKKRKKNPTKFKLLSGFRLYVFTESQVYNMTLKRPELFFNVFFGIIALLVLGVDLNY